MDKLDRAFQKQILVALADAYPTKVSPTTLFDESRRSEVVVNLAYLEEHGLVRLNWSRAIGEPPHPGPAGITAAGIDFLHDDGGLSAILGVVTVKLHEESLRALLVREVAQSSDDETIKGQVIAQIKALPAEGLKTIATKSLEVGLSRIPQLAHFIQGLLT